MNAVIRVVSVVVLLGIVSFVSAQPACGNIDLGSAPDASKFAKCETADSISAYGNKILTSVSLPSLISVGDINFVNNPVLTVISMPRLGVATTKYGISIAGNGALVSIDMGALRTTQALSIYVNGALTSLAMDSLASVDGQLYIESCQVPVISMPQLTFVGDMGFDSNIGTVAVYMPSLKTVNEAVIFYSHPVLQAISFPNLQHVGNRFWIHDNAALKVLSMPVLTTMTAIDLYSNPALVAVSFPKLATIPDNWFRFWSNPSLESVDLSSLTAFDNFNIADSTAIVSCQPWLVEKQAICPKACDVIDLSKDPAAFANCGSAKSLQATSVDSLKTIRLVALTSVAVDIYVRNNANLDTLSLPLLATAGRLFLGPNYALKTFNVPNLYRMTDYVFFEHNGFATLSMPLLASVQNNFDVTSSPSMTSMSVPNLQTTGSITVMDAPAMSTPLEFPSLQTIAGSTSGSGYFWISMGPAKSVISAPWLTSISYSLIITNNVDATVNLLRLKTFQMAYLLDCAYVLSCQPTLMSQYGAVCPKSPVASIKSASASTLNAKLHELPADVRARHAASMRH